MVVAVCCGLVWCLVLVDCAFGCCAVCGLLLLLVFWLRLCCVCWFCLGVWLDGAACFVIMLFGLICVFLLCSGCVVCCLGCLLLIVGSLVWVTFGCVWWLWV